MADATLTSMTDIATIAGTELIYVDNGSADRKTTVNEILAYRKTQDLDMLEFVCDGGGSALTAKTYGFIEVPYGCTLKQVTALADVSGSCVVEIWKTTYSAFDISTHPVTGDKLNGAGTATTISTAVKAQDATLTSWTTSFSAGDILAFHINSATTITRVTVSLKVQRT
jgi:hypothetical protein